MKLVTAVLQLYKRRSSLVWNYEWRALVCALLVVACLGSFCASLEAARTGVEWRTVRVATNINKSIYLDSKGKPQGYAWPYLRALAKQNHWMLEFVPGNWNESVKRLEDSRVDLLFPTQKTAERLATMSFAELTSGYQPLVLFSKKNGSYYYDDFEGFNNARIAVSQGSSNELALQSFAQQHNFTYQPVYINSTQEKLDALADQKLDLVAVSSLVDTSNLQAVAYMSYEPFYFSTRKNDVGLSKQLDEGMKQVLARQPELASKLYLDFLGHDVQIAPTRDENAWLQDKKKIVVGVYEETAPLFCNVGGKPHGVYVDLIKHLSEKTGMQLELYPISRDHYAYRLLENGTIDILLGSNDAPLSAAHSNAYMQSAPIMKYSTVGVAQRSYIPVKDGKTRYVLTKARSYWESYIKQQHPNAVISYVKNAKDCLIQVQEGKADVTLLNTWEYNYLSKNARFNDLRELESEKIAAEVIMVALAHADPHIFDILNKGIATMSTSEMDAMVAANLNRPYDDYNLVDYIYGMKTFLLVVLAVVVVLVLAFAFYTMMRRRYIASLVARNEELNAANQAKSLFLSRMSHELRTPLNIIACYAQLLEAEQKAKNAQGPEVTQLKGIVKAERYLLNVINGILDIQMIENDKFELHPSVYNATEYMADLVQTVEQEAVDKHIHFSYQRDKVLDDYYYADGDRLGQILYNILHNAVKFTPAGGSISLVSGEELLEPSSDQVLLHFVVTDTGVGMSEEFVQKQLFGVFMQEDTSIASPYDGAGIGMNFSRAIARKMGGDIICTSEKDKGSVFTLTAVVKRATAEDMQSQLEKRNAAESIDLLGKTILVCEDNLINSRLLETLLVKRGAQVICAKDGQEGVKFFAESAPHSIFAVLMDIRMPVLDGYAATRQIRALEREDAQGVPIIAVSANAYGEDVQTALAAGMNDYLVKPIDVAKLYQTLGALMKN